MSSLPQTLRAVSDALLRDAEALVALEEQKREMTLDDPRIADVAAQIEAVATRVLARSAEERELAEQAPDTDSGAGSIAATRRPIRDILAEWREVERRLDAAPEGSAEALEASVLARRIREEYAQALTSSRA